MGVMKDANGNLMSGYSIIENSGFNGTLSDGNIITDGTDFPESKYYDVYDYGDRTNYSRRILGDATGELGPFQSQKSSWYNDVAYFTLFTLPWFYHGGSHIYGYIAGALHFNSGKGQAYSYDSFRLVLSI